MALNGSLPRRYFTSSRHSLRDEYELDFSDLSPSRASSPASAKSEGPRHHSRRHSQVEEYRRKVARLRSELDLEKARNRQVYKEKNREVRDLREQFEEDKKYEIDIIQAKLKDAKDKEMTKLRETLLKEKDQELQQVLKYKEEEVKHLKMKMTSDKTETDETQKEINKTPTKVVKMPRDMDLLRRMEEEIQKLKDENSTWESKYSKKCDDETKKEKEFVKMKEDYDTELRRIISESKKLALGNLKKLKRAEIALSESMISDDESVSAVSEKSASRRSLANIDDNMSTSTMSLNKTLSLDKQSSVTSDSDRDETKREEREKEKSLQKKVTELQGQIQRLERRITLLRSENDTLRKQKDDHKPLEEKIKALKKRNAELAAIARRLEEKAKHLQQENTKKTKEETFQDSDQLKRLFARQRAKDLADHAKSMLTKDREIEELRKKCQELADQLSNGDYLAPENVQVYEEKEELVTIIKQAAKERLQLERQVAKHKPGEVVQQADPEHTRHVKELEVNNQDLQREVHELEKALQRTKHLDSDLNQKTEECDILKASIGKQREHNQELEADLKVTETKNTKLTFEISELNKRLKDYDKVNEECSTLRLTLAEVQHEREIAKEDVSTLQYKVDSLETLVRDLQQSSEQLHQLENDYQEALRKLDQKQSEIDKLHEAQEEAKIEHERDVQELQIRIQELERQCQVHEYKQAELTSELSALKKHALQEKHTPTVTKSTEIQTDPTPQISTGTDALPLLHSNNPNRRSSSNQNGHYIEDSVLPSQFMLSETGISQIPTSESSKSLDTGFAEDEVDDELSSNNKSSPNKSDCEDPELNEIAKKLKELAASDSDDDNANSLEEKEDSGMESNRGSKNQNEISLSESRLSSLARKGPIQVYVAKYSYRPYQHSPNENPDAELPLNAGDYVLILGDMDEDGFYEGELVDGRRGLVPSNFIEKVAEEDLADFHAAMAVAGHHSDDSNITNIQQDLEFNSSDEIDKLQSDIADDARKGRLDSHGELKDIEEVDESVSGKTAAFPRNLSIDRQLTNSILLSWKAPELTGGLEISSYHIFIDKEFKTSVRGNERTKALVEGVDSKAVHRISVRCLSNQGQSLDAQCTVLVGKDATPTPTELKVSDVTANSATISWLPGNSNYQHSIAVNGKEVRVVKPSVFKYTLTGLAPESQHKVTVQAKSLTATYEDEKNPKRKEMLTESIEFKTTAGGLPDPPLNVQVESGPQEGTLLLTWLPVTINTSGFSNGAVVTGYSIYADGRRAKEAKGPTNDHIVLGADDFKGFIPKQLTVRTVTVDRKESTDSSIIRLPHNLIKEVTARAAKTVASEVIAKSAHRSSKSPTGTSENAGNDTDEEIEAAFREAQEAGEQLSTSPENSNYADPYLESSSSELSDIPEVEEEMIGEETNQNADISGHSLSLVASFPQATNQAEEKKSPKPVPRKIGIAGHSPTNDPMFQREDNPASDKRLSPQRKIPAIEITRDSSTERGTSFEEETENVSMRTSPYEQTDNPDSSQNTPPVVPRRRVSPGGSFSVDLENKDFRDRKMESPSSVDFDRHHRSGSPRSQMSGSPRGQTPIKSRRISPQSPGFRTNRSTPNENGNDLDFDENGDVDSISGEINPPVDDNMIRLFIALFDYDPNVMSPNMDGADEELPFREGQILKIYGEKDADGFYRGECNGHLGYVPCNMVSEIHIDDPELIDQLLKESQGNPVNKSQLPHQEKEKHHLTPNGIPPVPSDEVGRKMVALYDYDPQELSPNVDSDLELTFKAGDLITIYGEMDEDGFFRGEMNKRRGFVPSNFLQEATTAPLSDDEALESASMVSPSRSGESISALSRNSDGIANTTRVEPPSPRSELLNLDQVISHNPRVTPPNQQPAPEENKHKKKGGIFNKGKNIFKKLAR